MYPKAKVIYVLRNPLGHFNSYKNNLAVKKKKNNTLAGTRNNYIFKDYGHIGKWLLKMALSYQLVDEFLYAYPNNFYVLCYDHLLYDPHTELSLLCNFLNIPLDISLYYPSVLGQILMEIAGILTI